jgi:hypothetical protein
MPRFKLQIYTRVANGVHVKSLVGKGGRNPKAFLQEKKSQKTHAANCVGGKVTRLVIFLLF